MSTTDLVKTEPEKKTNITIGSSGIQLTNLAEAYRFAEAVVASNLAPKGDTAASVLIKLQAGMELGFQPMQALKVLCVVNGKLSMEGKGMLALIRNRRVARVMVFNEGTGDQRAGVFEFERFDTGEKGRVTFTWAEAVKAGLSGKDTYKNYGDDMLVWRATARGCNRYFSDLVLGMEVSEAADDMPAAPSNGAPPMVERTPPSTLDPLLLNPSAPYVPTAEVVEPEIPPCDPGMTHAEADAALADAPGDGRLFPATSRRHRG